MLPAQSEGQRAAQYVRMSTDMQKYSIENQAKEIAQYAVARNIEIVRTYTDAGRSGLRITGRPALSQLLNDVRLGNRDFNVVLVYDVSRWGRFQDADESAYYEYLCKEAGVSVEYCAEQFPNDNSLSAALLKSIKRVMAGEYSRELSVKVFAGQANVASKGFHVCAAPLIGLRRCMIDETGQRRIVLERGERKSIKSDRIILVPGPPDEIEIIRLIFRLFVDERLFAAQIVEFLNRRGIRPPLRDSWNEASVYNILKNEKYAGTNVYGKFSSKLGAKTKKNPVNVWIRVEKAFQPVIEPNVFAAAQRRLHSNANPYTNEYLLAALSATWCKYGHLSRFVIDRNRFGPQANSYRDHFGGLIEAYREIGYKNSYVSGYANNRQVARKVSTELLERLRAKSLTVRPLSNRSFSVNDELVIRLAVGRKSPNGPSDCNLWKFAVKSDLGAHILIVVRCEGSSDKPKDYFVLPAVFMPRGENMVRMSGRTYLLFERFRTDTLEAVCELCTRKPLEAA